MWKCPQCGEENLDTALMCGLCGERRPEEKPQEIVARALGPTPPPPNVPPIPTGSRLPDRVNTGQSWDAVGSRYLSDEEKRQLAERAAQEIMGPSVQATANKTGCGTLILFICFLPWSLILLPMPGGLKNRNAFKILAVIAVVLVLVSILGAATMLPSLMGKIQALGNAYKDAAGG